MFLDFNAGKYNEDILHHHTADYDMLPSDLRGANVNVPTLAGPGKQRCK